LTGKQKIHVFVTAQTAIYHCTIASYHCTFCVSLHTILCPAIVEFNEVSKCNIFRLLNVDMASLKAYAHLRK